MEIDFKVEVDLKDEVDNFPKSLRKICHLGNPDRVWSCPALILFDIDQSATIYDEEGEEQNVILWF